MQLQVPPDLISLINKRPLSGAYRSAEEVLRRALELQNAEESLTDQERLEVPAHIEEGYLQAERGELVEVDEARAQLESMKEDWQRTRG